jgi:Zn ribbon nucleic-acid-binding protein
VFLEEKKSFFDDLEKKEETYQKLDSIKELKITAVRCTKCEYVAQKAAKFCIDNKHTLKKVPGVKRFWLCGNCKYQFETINLKFPVEPCVRCQHTDFQASTMLKYRPKVVENQLKPTGEYFSSSSSRAGVFQNGFVSRFSKPSESDCINDLLNKE